MKLSCREETVDGEADSEQVQRVAERGAEARILLIAEAAHAVEAVISKPTATSHTRRGRERV